MQLNSKRTLFSYDTVRYKNLNRKRFYVCDGVRLLLFNHETINNVVSGTVRFTLLNKKTEIILFCKVEIAL